MRRNELKTNLSQAQIGIVKLQRGQVEHPPELSARVAQDFQRSREFLEAGFIGLH